MPVTREQALTESIFHYAPDCTAKRVVRYRRNGKTQTWKTRPNAFRIPVKHGMYSYDVITELDASEFHVASECPIHGQRY